MKKNLFTILGIILLGIQPSFAQKTWTLEECMAYAQAHNTEIAQRMNELNMRDTGLQLSKDSRLPLINAELGQTVNSGTNTSLGTPMKADMALTSLGASFSMPLFTGGRISSQINSDVFSVHAATADLKSAEKNLRINIACYYLQVLYAKAQRKIAERKLEVSQSTKQRALSLFNHGKCPESEVAEAEALLSRDEADLVTADGDLVIARLNLAHLMNIPEVESFDVTELDEQKYQDSDLVSPAVLYGQIESNYPTIQSAYYGIKKAEQDVKIAKSALLPTISLVGSFQDMFYGMFKGDTPGFWNQAKNNYQTAVGLKLTYKLFDANDAKHRVKMAKIAVNNAEVYAQETKLQLRKDIQQAYYNATIAQKKYIAEQKTEASNNISYTYMVKSYDAGRSTIFELNQSKQQMFASSQNALRAKYEYMIRKIILDIYSEN